MCGGASLSVSPSSFCSFHENFRQKPTGQGLKSRKKVPRAHGPPLRAWSPPSPFPNPGPGQPVPTPWTRPSTPPQEEGSRDWVARAGVPARALPHPGPTAWPCTQEVHRPRSDRPAARSAPASWPAAEMNSTDSQPRRADRTTTCAADRLPDAARVQRGLTPSIHQKGQRTPADISPGTTRTWPASTQHARHR